MKVWIAAALSVVAVGIAAAIFVELRAPTQRATPPSPTEPIAPTPRARMVKGWAPSVAPVARPAEPIPRKEARLERDASQRLAAQMEDLRRAIVGAQARRGTQAEVPGELDRLRAELETLRQRQGELRQGRIPKELLESTAGEPRDR